MFEALESISASPVFPLLAGMVACHGFTQIAKRIAKAAGVRNHPAFERTLPLVPSVVGVALFAALPRSLGVDLLVAGDGQSIHLVGAIFGAVLGLFSAGVYSAFVEAFPGVEKYLKHSADTDSEKG